jgi:hypothetical protein
MKKRPKKKTEPKKILLPFSFGHLVPGNSSAVVTVQPQVFMRVERLWVSREVGSCFYLSDIKVGNMSRFASAGEFSMAVFDNDDQLYEPRKYPDPCIGVVGPGIYVGLYVRNGSACAVYFTGHLEGVEYVPEGYKLGAGGFIT